LPTTLGSQPSRLSGSSRPSMTGCVLLSGIELLLGTELPRCIHKSGIKRIAMIAKICYWFVLIAGYHRLDLPARSVNPKQSSTTVSTSTMTVQEKPEKHLIRKKLCKLRRRIPCLFLIFRSIEARTLALWFSNLTVMRFNACA
jgi:hypothetical protein